MLSSLLRLDQADTVDLAVQLLADAFEGDKDERMERAREVIVGRDVYVLMS
ncbi:hypothetical protein ACQE92_05545 [Ornithinimicrobium sp. Y1694]